MIENMIENIISPSLLAPMSRLKLEQLSLNDSDLIFNSDTKNILLNLLNSIKESSITNFDLEQIESSNIEKLFSDFNKKFNNCSVQLPTKIISMSLKNITGLIKLNFLYDDLHIIPQIIYATNMFTNLFKINYDGLTINVLLDDNNRIIDPQSKSDPKIKIKEQRKKCLGFTISGVTYKHNKLINLTKKEEIIKLLFHELIHYAGLDINFYDTEYNSKYDIDNKNLNISEAYTEFLAVILNVAFMTININPSDNMNKIYDKFEKILKIETEYSVYLTTNILRFYDYDLNNYKDFFDNNKR